jgi:putative glutamine amidotransferase
MKKPVIGLMPLWDDKRDCMRMHPGYHDLVLASGGIPVILPFAKDDEELKQLTGLCDGFVYTGGQDIDPSFYGEEINNEKVYTCPRRDDLETRILKFIMEADKPVFGICRGIQVLNVALGGSLYQDLPTDLPSPVHHWQTEESFEPTHTVNIVPGSPLEKCLGKSSLKVNSFHHQGIKDPAPGIEIMARTEDGLVESFRLPESRFFWAVQWHPEMMFEHDADSLRLFGMFIEACK